MILNQNLMMIQLAVCLLLTGLIWTIQIVHYPAFLYVGKNEFPAFEAFHVKAISVLVMPLMLAEVLLAAQAFLRMPSNLYYNVSLACLVGIWLCTLLISSPLHAKLSAHGYQKEWIEQLVYTNWPRSILWTVRSGILFYLISTKENF